MTTGPQVAACTRARRGRAHGAVLVAVLLAVVGVVATACIPSERGKVSEVGDPALRGEVPGAPVFPDTGVVPDDLLAAGLVHDLTTRPMDTSFWVPSLPEAECVAGGVVESVGGARLSELGYRPATAGASLSDLDLEDAEAAAVADVIEDCVDMVEAVASMFFGDGRIRASVASCLAEGLGRRGALRPFAVAMVSGEVVDPYSSDLPLATAVLEQSVVCVPDGEFNWPDLDLPDEDPVLDADAPAGASGSPFVDDQRTTTTSTP